MRTYAAISAAPTLHRVHGHVRAGRPNPQRTLGALERANRVGNLLRPLTRRRSHNAPQALLVHPLAPIALSFKRLWALDRATQDNACGGYGLKRPLLAD